MAIGKAALIGAIAAVAIPYVAGRTGDFGLLAHRGSVHRCDNGFSTVKARDQARKARRRNRWTILRDAAAEIGTRAKGLFACTGQNRDPQLGVAFEGVKYLTEFMTRVSVQSVAPIRPIQGHQHQRTIDLNQTEFVRHGSPPIQDRPRLRGYIDITVSTGALWTKAYLIKKNDTFGDKYHRLQNGRCAASPAKTLHAV